VGEPATAIHDQNRRPKEIHPMVIQRRQPPHEVVDEQIRVRFDVDPPFGRRKPLVGVVQDRDELVLVETPAAFKTVQGCTLGQLVLLGEVGLEIMLQGNALRDVLEDVDHPMVSEHCLMVRVNLDGMREVGQLMVEVDRQPCFNDAGSGLDEYSNVAGEQSIATVS
jgi:hypothetical protein